MVNGAVTVVLVIFVREIVLANVPFPEYTPGIVAWPVITKPVPPRVAVPVRVNVLLTVAACTPAQASSANDKVKNVRFISLLESLPEQLIRPPLGPEVKAILTNFRPKKSRPSGRILLACGAKIGQAHV